MCTSLSWSIQWRKPKQASPGALVLTRLPWTRCTLSSLALPLLLAHPDHYRDRASLKGGKWGLSRAHNLSDSHQELLWPLPFSPGPLPHKANTMCNRFVGTWKLVSSENFDDYMKELGERCCILLFNLILFNKFHLGMSVLHLTLFSCMLSSSWLHRHFNYFSSILSFIYFSIY